CHFQLEQLNYTYPAELVPNGLNPSQHLRALTLAGSRERWPSGVPSQVAAQIEHELQLVADLGYEHFFLTVHDIVAYARSLGILCQGRGSAANSAVCYCLGITEVNPTQGHLLFERFISRERNEPPDIDVDFEHERREEVIQYIYAKYGRERAGLAATVISYRTKSAVRELAKVLGLAQDQIDALVRSMAWWDGRAVIPERMVALGLDPDSKLIKRFAWLLEQLIGMPRHLSQHVGGFVISHHPLHTLVPVENAAMPDRTIIQWDKDDLEALGLLKVDVLALGMLSAIRKCFHLIQNTHGQRWTLANIPQEDTATYDMICKADTIGVFQIESRAQMTMLPRLRPRTFYDLVIEVAIVRPGPIQGGMVNPYLKRRQGLEEVSYPSEALKAALDRTLGVPVFQEQVMQIAMIAAGFDAGEADALRRSMAAWGRHGTVDQFQQKLMQGMYERGYPTDFAEAVFNQIKGFGAYGFPESHAASFALLVYASCWLKCHYPAEFCCAILNSQPMGFYPPSDLVRDAREHGVTVHPVDVLHSTVDHSLEPLPNGNPAVRLGLRLVQGLSKDAAVRIVQAREQNTFVSVADLCLRCELNKHDQQALADANALRALASHRHKAVWEILGVEKLPGLLREASQIELPLALDAPAEGQDVAADYRSTGLTLGRHPLALLRPVLNKRRVISAAEWKRRHPRAHVRVAGLVTVRQRPGSAKGVMFMTLEDETDRMNIVLWADVLERYRQAILGTSLVIVAGDTQRVEGVAHLVAKKVEDASYLLGEMDVKGRNFH
ncbi:MAG: error-prone DNA polymerase, partial [Granulosicoccaceae bacterium]